MLGSHLVRLTSLRHRRDLDAALAEMLHELLRPSSVGVFRPVGAPEDLRWSTRAWHGSALQASSVGMNGADARTLLPVLNAYPLRCQALRGQTCIERTQGEHLVVLPLQAGKEVVGVVEVQTVQPLGQTMLDMLDALLHVYRNVHELLDNSERDTLTGLLNRSTFDDTLLGAAPDDHERRGPRQVVNTWAAVVDVDHFKSVNDRFGHLIGDEVLILLARLMRVSFRRSDGLYRFGGEEFVVLIHDATSQDTHNVFERFRQATESFPFPQVGRLTVSIGYTEVRPGESPSDVIGRADEAVYYAKSNGRNQTHNHATLVANGALRENTRVGETELF